MTSPNRTESSTVNADAAPRVALITGLGRRNGIARGIALRLAEEGWDIAFNYWTPYESRMSLGGTAESPSEIAEELRATGRRVLAIEADLEDPVAPAEILDLAAAELGPVSALILSHSESVDSSILDTTVESFDRHYAVNVRAAWLLIRAFALQAPPEGGAIVALTSDHVVHNLPYGSSKGALDRIVIAAARELGERGISSNALNPGPVDTGWMDDEIRASGVARQPTGRLGTPTDIANVVSFLVSPAGRWISGQLVKADGGFSV
ncbi:SDR family oxidoreductase [Mycetocola manganoxydans]|uniref:SDR family oxidoreductase n=1 Tax=Mycetocola manganoxydans TaxID=699879 RepID=A0A3L6ZWS0_9MICO|nr:SDR family oxidoreductase [Mycetocola manganoxydans]RLP72339.1 SDR family oxidoreductase [Mycetocola manganoxydans]